MLFPLRSALLTTLLLCLGASITLFAQATPVAETSLDSPGKEIYLHSFTGVPILQTAKGYAGLSPDTGEILWSSARSGAGKLNTLSASLGGEEEEGLSDYFEIPNSPMVFAGNKIVNVATGKIIVDGEEIGLKNVKAHYVLPANDIVLLEIAAKGAVYLYGIDPFTSAEKFSVLLREVKGLGLAAGGTDEGDDLRPRINAEGNLLYPSGKYLALIDPMTGTLKWNEKLNAGYIFTNKARTRMVIAEAKGSGLTGGMSMTGSEPKVKKFSKTVHLIDAATGQSVWKKEQKMDGNVIYITPFDGGFLIVNDEGMNVYDYDGDEKADGRWKKDYSEKGVTNVEKTDEGLMVYFKNKRMLVDPATGEEKWKKAEKLEKEGRTFRWATDAMEEGNAEEADLEEVGSHFFSVEGQTLVIDGEPYVNNVYDYAINGTDVLVVIEMPTNNLSKRRYNAILLDMTNAEFPSVVEQPTYEIDLGLPLNGVESTETGYFVYNPQNFQVYDKAMNIVKEGGYKDPNAAMKTLAKVGSRVGRGIDARQAREDVVMTDRASVNEYNRRVRAMNQDMRSEFESINQLGAQEEIMDENHVYLFGEEKGGVPSLFKIEKKSGDVVDTFVFDDATPVYVVDYDRNRLYFAGKDKFKIFDLN